MEFRLDHVWIFNGSGNLPSAVFSSHTLAEAWITGQKLSGVLTKYPLDISVYEWAIQNTSFKPKNLDQMEPRFIERFSSAYQEHYHYEAGQRS